MLIRCVARWLSCQPRLFLTEMEGNFEPRICHQGSLTLESGIGGVWAAILSRRRAPWELDILSSGHSAVGRLISPRLILMFVHSAFAFGLAALASSSEYCYFQLILSMYWHFLGFDLVVVCL